MSEQEHDITEEQARLREQLRLLSSNVNNHIHAYRNTIFGKVATIIEAAIADPAQRKSLKDLVSESIYGPSYWNYFRHQFDMIAKANGFDLHEDLPGQHPLVPLSEQPNEYDKA